jgi:5-methylthioribose kinase
LFELNPDTAARLAAAHFQADPATVQAWELPGGVSNLVFRARTPGHPDLVLKQSLAKLRVAADWFSERERIYDEIDALAALAPIAPSGALPAIVFEDRPNFCFAMTAAEESAPTWKQSLLAGEVNLDLARQAAALQAAFFALPHLESRFQPLDRFDQLRLDPYYRATAARHPDLAPAFAAAIAQARTNRRALTHGDWSPKNFLLNSGPRLFSIDYEVMHWGDPSFDSAFLLNHLLLKGWFRAGAQPLYSALAATYAAELLRLTGAHWLEAATLVHLGCLHLARVDGKSPVEYLPPATQAQVRRFARDLIQNPATTIAEVFSRQAEAFHE